jgi:hypothetical protein
MSPLLVTRRKVLLRTHPQPEEPRAGRAAYPALCHQLSFGAGVSNRPIMRGYERA